MSAAPARRRLRVVQWFAVSIGALALIAVLGLTAGLLALGRLSDARETTVDRVDPAITAALRLSGALLDEETGVRGYALTRDRSFLAPYTAGRREEAAALADLDRRLGDLSGGERLVGDLDAARRAAASWRTGFAEPVIADVRGGRASFRRIDQAAGRVMFDEVRSSLDDLQRDLQRRRQTARARLQSIADQVRWIFIGFGALLLVSVVAAGLLLRRVVVLPLGRLAESVRHVSRGDFQREVQGDGAREVVELGEDVDAMRGRILAELDALSATRDELQRSNAELEQFAYVASHDLQEPLRKVASFTQMLQRRYEGQLDERADQYIGFAVDGAKRMQELINDLLAFSRVGRFGEAQAEVAVAALVEQARTALAGRLEESGGRIDVVGELPVVRGEPSLLALVFQNLMGNGLKFHGDEPPVVRVSVERDGSDWAFTIADNGIGIEPEYADRIFVIFQRLHPRTSYEGTGIGLAMCRKIVEYHGGRIWLDTEPSAGAVFHFTLPAIPQAAPADQPQEATAA
jgi:signal transduction histidine kinase